MLSEFAKSISTIYVALLISSSTSFAEDKGAYFQNLDETAQRALVSNSVGMTLTIASETDKNLMRCIVDWYGTGEKKRSQQDVVLDLIRQHQDFWPESVILAHIQKFAENSLHEEDDC